MQTFTPFFICLSLSSWESDCPKAHITVIPWCLGVTQWLIKEASFFPPQYKTKQNKNFLMLMGFANWFLSYCQVVPRLSNCVIKILLEEYCGYILFSHRSLFSIVQWNQGIILMGKLALGLECVKLCQEWHTIQRQTYATGFRVTHYTDDLH